MACILVIEDEELGRFTLRKMLEAGGHEVLEAENGEQGLSRFKEGLVDLVVTDIIMPKQEGLETIRKLRHRYPETKIIAISGGDRPNGSGMLREATMLGAQGVLPKPFRKKKLLELIDGMLQGK